MNFFEDKYAKVDKGLMNEGAKVDFGSGFFVTVRHVSADKVTSARAAITKQMRVGNRNKELTADQNTKIAKYVAAHAGIVSWEGGGVPSFTPELAEQVFEDRPEFLDDVLTAMSSYETFREEELEAVSGN